MSAASRSFPRGRDAQSYRRPVSVLAIDSRGAPLTPGLDLRTAGIELSSCSTGPAALLAIGEAPPDVVIVPTDLAGVDLLEFVEAVCAWSHTAVVVGVGAGPDSPRAAYGALECGARGLVSLPLTPSALAMATVNLGLGNTRARTNVNPGVGDVHSRPEVLTVGSVRLDPGALCVTVGDKSAQLTLRQLQTLRYLMNQAPSFVSLDELAHEVDPTAPVGIATMKTTVSRLRRAFTEASIPAGVIELSHGNGYRVNGSIAGAGNPSDSNNAINLR